MAAQDMIFTISGRVINTTTHAPVPNHGIKIICDYHQFISGVSQPGQQTLSYATDANGNYSYTFPGPGNPLISWDNAQGIVVSVGNAVVGWVADEIGQYSGTPQGNSPLSIQVSDTEISQPNPGGG
jgi:hypothetical protein